ncbi:hypothetical protein QUW15_10740 [Desulfovibrio piger]|nr:hypothetical protein [Desulfovibrio piger]
MTELKFGTEPLVYEEKGDILLNYCFSITLYSLDMSAPQQKEAVLAIFDDYRALYGSRMRWAFSSPSPPLHGSPSQTQTAA